MVESARLDSADEEKLSLTGTSVDADRDAAASKFVVVKSDESIATLVRERDQTRIESARKALQDVKGNSIPAISK